MSTKSNSNYLAYPYLNSFTHDMHALYNTSIFHKKSDSR